MEMVRPEKKRLYASALVAAGLGLTAVALAANFYPRADSPPNYNQGAEPNPESKPYPAHHDITATVFWVGESADPSNKFIHNRSSAWVEDWVGAYSGVDDPSNRCGHRPCGFIPKENPFYFALPYNDLDENGTRKETAKNVPWYDTVQKTEGESILKNRWVKIAHDDITAYAQWEDVGPFGEDDFEYVFGDKQPMAPEAGIDLSPATAALLQVNGRSNVAWQFVNESDVPAGPWRDIITKN